MALTSQELAAIAKLNSTTGGNYPGDAGGLGTDGHRVNFVPALQAVATVGQAAAREAGDAAAAAATITAALNSKLTKTANLSDLTDVAAARMALQLGSAALSAAAAFATASQGSKADSAVQAVQAGPNVTIDNTDPRRPVISATGGGGGGSGTVTSVNISPASGSGLSASGGPVTGAGVIQVGFAAGYQALTDTQAGLISTAVQPGALASYVPDTRSLTAGTGLAGGGTLADNRALALSSASIASLALADTAVQPAALASYVPTTRTVSAGTGLAGGGALSGNLSLALSSGAQSSLALADTAVQPAALSSYVPTSRAVSAGTGLTGGGNLTDNRSVALSATSIASLALADSAVQSIVAGGNVVVDNTDPRRPVISATGSGGGGGTVLSVGLSAPTGFGVGGSPVTGSGTLTLSYAAGYEGFTTALKSTINSAVQPGALGSLAAKSKVVVGDITATGTAGATTYLRGDGAWAAPPAATGTVTSVGGAPESGSNLTVTGGPVTGAGTLTVGFAAGYSALSTAQASLIAAAVPGTRTVTAGTGLTGGGDLAANRTIALSAASIASLAKADTAVQPGALGALASKNLAAISDISATGTPGAGNFLRGDGTWSTPAGGAGTVTSVGLSAPTGFSVSGTPVTGAGTLALSFAAGYQGYTSAEATKLGVISAGADVTSAANVGSSIHGAAAKTTPVDADTVPLIDSAASNALKRVTWANIKSTFKAYFDTLYASASSVLSLASATAVRAGTDTTSAMGVKATWDAMAPVALTDAATIALDLASGVGSFTVTLGGNRTLGNPTNAKPGQKFNITVSRAAAETLSFGTAYVAMGPIALPASGKRFKVVGEVISASEIHIMIVGEP